MTVLSVVVANRIAVASDAAAAAEGWRRELDPSDQLIWVDRAGLHPADLGLPADCVTAPAGASRGVCYGLGMAHARGPLVAFTDSTTVAGPGWRAAARGALDAGAAVVGGPVLPAVPPSPPSWAGFLVDYAPHAVPPYTSATGDVAGNNVLYRRHLLPTDGGPIWKAEVNARLAAEGIRAVTVPGMTVAVNRSYGWRDLGPRRARSAAHYANHRSATWPRRSRLPRAAACGALPAVALWRLWSTVRAHPELRTNFARSLPWVVLALVAWSVGEAAGYVMRIGDRDVW